jgi:tetratricopeptide (TPR) repeat protein
MDRPDEAAECLRKAAELAPEDDDVRLSLGEVLFKLGHFSDALEVFVPVAERRPKNALVWLRIGDAHHALSRDQLALDAYENALSRDPRSAEAWLKKAVALFHLGRYPEALGAADRTLEIDFRSDFALYIKSAVYFSLGDYEHSMETAERAVAQNPLNRDAARLAEICRSHQRQGEGGPVIREVFIVLNDGRLLAHASRHPGQTADELLVTGMFTAIRRFIKDSFRLAEGEELGMLEIGQLKILVEQWKNIFSAVVIAGQEPPGLRKEMRRMLVSIYDRYHEMLRSWDGDTGSLDGIVNEASRLLA